MSAFVHDKTKNKKECDKMNKPVKNMDNKTQQQFDEADQKKDIYAIAYFMLRARLANWSDIAKHCSPELQRKMLKEYLNELMSRPGKSS